MTARKARDPRYSSDVQQDVVTTENTTAEPGPASPAEITHKLADDVSPLVERVRQKFDVFYPFVEELRPLMNDLRPIVEDVRPMITDARSLVGVALRYLRAAFVRVQPRLEPALRSAGTLAIDVAGRARTMRPPVVTPSVSLPALHMPAAPTIRVPTVGRPRIVLPVGAIARRLRPGRRAFRAVMVGIIVVALSEPTVRTAITEQLDSAASFVETAQLPAVDLSKIELPAIELPAIEMPKFELPTIDLSKIELPAFQVPSQPSAAPPRLAPATFELPPLDAYRATFVSQAAYPTVAPNGSVEWVVALRNTGSVGWYRGVAGAQASLALPDGTEAAVQTTPYVAPGQVGWFVVRFRAPATPGTQTVPLYPRIDGRGELPDLGLFTLVTVR
jgi:hypothetical protein